MSTSLKNMVSLIAECRWRHCDLGHQFSSATISDICNHIQLPFLIEPLTTAGQPGKSRLMRERALKQLRSFGPNTGEFYFAEAMQPSIVNVVAQKSGRARWIHQLIQEGESKTEAIARVIKLWQVPDNAAQLDTLCLEREYREWRQQQADKPA